MHYIIVCVVRLYLRSQDLMQMQMMISRALQARTQARPMCTAPWAHAQPYRSELQK